MNRLLGLGSNFFAFLGGGAISAAASVYTGLFLAASLSSEWPLVMTSVALLTAAGLLLAYTAIVVGELDASITALPSQLSSAARTGIETELRASSSKRLKVLAASSAVTLVLGLAGLPLALRLSEAGGPRQADNRSHRSAGDQASIAPPGEAVSASAKPSSKHG